jgi:hypothetical protein
MNNQMHRVHCILCTTLAGTPPPPGGSDVGRTRCAWSRLATQPAGNIPVTLLDIWYTMLERIGLKHGYPDTVVADIAQCLLPSST